MGEVSNFLESGIFHPISDAHPKVILGCVSSVFRRGLSQMICGSGGKAVRVNLSTFVELCEYNGYDYTAGSESEYLMLRIASPIVM